MPRRSRRSSGTVWGRPSGAGAARSRPPFRRSSSWRCGAGARMSAWRPVLPSPSRWSWPSSASSSAPRSATWQVQSSRRPLPLSSPCGPAGRRRPSCPASSPTPAFSRRPWSPSRRGGPQWASSSVPATRARRRTRSPGAGTGAWFACAADSPGCSSGRMPSVSPSWFRSTSPPRSPGWARRRSRSGGRCGSPPSRSWAGSSWRATPRWSRGRGRGPSTAPEIRASAGVTWSAAARRKGWTSSGSRAGDRAKGQTGLVDWYLERTDQLADLRHELVAYLARHAAPEGEAGIDDAELLVSEAVGNALRHTGGPVWVSLTWSSELPTLQVYDLGGQMEAEFRVATEVVGRMTPEQLGECYVRLKHAIDGQFSVVEATPERIVLENRRCPFGEAVRHAPALCRMTSSVFGGLAARNHPEGATVLLEERIAVGDPGCRVVVYLGRAPAEVAPYAHRYRPPA